MFVFLVLMNPRESVYVCVYFMFTSVLIKTVKLCSQEHTHTYSRIREYILMKKVLGYTNQITREIIKQ